MIDLLETFESLVNQNTKPDKLYNFQSLDELNLHKKSYLLDLAGPTDCLKTRLMYYWINSLVSHGKDCYLISIKPSDQRMIDLEIEHPERLIVAEINLLEDIYDFILELPPRSYIFLDGLYSVNTLEPKYIGRPYLTAGKILKHLKNKFGHKIHITSSINGFKHVPISYVFKDSIDYKCSIKRVRTKKGFVGLDYRPIGGYHLFSLGESKQIVYASVNSRIIESETNIKKSRKSGVPL